MSSTPKKYLFIYAHMDDETILSYGTIRRLRDNGHKVYVLTVCGNGRKDASNENTAKRKQAVFDSLGKYATDMLVGNFYDLNIAESPLEKLITEQMEKIKPDVVVTHTSSDLHKDHVLVNNIATVALRKKPGFQVSQFLTTQGPVNRWNYGNNKFAPNVFFDISAYVVDKAQSLIKFIGEIPDAPEDLRSPTSIIEENKMHGRVMGVSFCEVYEQIFRYI